MLPRTAHVVAAALFAVAAAHAQATGDAFTDGPNGAKVHVASGFVCPMQLASFERDAVGESDPEAGAVFCAYSALDGVYGTITLVPLPATYDPKTLLAPEFVVEEGSGGHPVDEKNVPIGPRDAPVVTLYTRAYETAKLETLHYRTLFASAPVGAWAAEVTLEYAEPRDADIAKAYLNAAYLSAVKKLASP